MPPEPQAGRPIRVLTVGMKPAVNEALAERDDLEVAALTQGETEAKLQGRLRVLPYALRAKVSTAAARGVREAAAAWRPDVVQTYGSRPLAHTTLAFTGRRDRPPIVSYRGVTSVPSRLRLEDWITYLSPLVDAHACESAASRDGLMQGGVDPTKCFLAYNCLTRPPASGVGREALGEFDIPADATVVAMVANFRRVKGGDVLLEAARRLADLPNVYYLLLGEVRDRRLVSLANDPAIAPRVRLAGFRADAMDLATAADLFVMPSRAEALCVALLEAMSCGVCPIVSDAGGMKEAVRDGVDGLVVPKGSPEPLADAIRRLCQDPQERLAKGRSAADRFNAMFSREAVAERFARGYRELLNGGLRARQAA
ncbi:N,N'-diacetylbacillosaminyl-diphospho-undecaprenol alpha-1,3-N-acetylgalactosaminyltransferase [Planctomycetes bacterium MalM25]|nr:N,N'-diacetylbacillosaminyl-diphospho-undecaprenol alpha-1,3-N-acetylgalactosaminyltransferase [Planctomycetes bacterium MalM25]